MYASDHFRVYHGNLMARGNSLVHELDSQLYLILIYQADFNISMDNKFVGNLTLVSTVHHFVPLLSLVCLI